MSYSLLALPCDCVVVTMSVKEFDALMNAADDVADVYGDVTSDDCEGDLLAAEQTRERAQLLRQLANQYYEVGQRDD
jgi:hypothetical protein